MRKLSHFLFFSVVMISLFTSKEVIKPVSADYPWGWHQLTFNYYQSYIYDDHDSPGPGEWKFGVWCVYPLDESKETGEYSVDGARTVDHEDLIFEFIMNPSDVSTTEFSMKADEYDLGIDWNAAAGIWYTLPIDWGYSMQPNRAYWFDQRDGDTRFYWWIKILNQAPRASTIVVDESVVVVDVPVSFQGSGYDPEQDSISYEWDFGDGGTSAEQNPTHAYSNVGTYTVCLRVEDYFGSYSDVIFTNVTVTQAINQAPVISHPISGPDTVYRGDTVTFSVTATDPDGNYPLYYVWTINGYDMGVNDPTLSFVHTMEPGSVGENVVAVEVYDSLGAFTEVTKIFTTLNHAPTISAISGDTSGYRDIEYSWSATGSDADGDALTYEWYVDDTWVSGDSSPAYTFDSGAALGAHTIKVRVQDEIGDYSDYSTLTFTLTDVPNDPPTISGITGPDSAYVGETCTFNAIASDPDGDDVTITWYLDGSFQATGTSFTYTFETEAAGEYTIQARAQDSKGASSDYSTLTFTLLEETGLFHCSFDVPWEETVYVVETCSNSSVSDLTFNQPSKRIRFSVDGATGTAGFCNITIPAELLSGDFTVLMGDTLLVEGIDYTAAFNGTHHTLSITYEHSTHMIEVVGTIAIPEFASWLFLPFIMLATLSALIARSLKKRRKIQAYACM